MRDFPIKVPAETLNAINHGPYRFTNVHSYQVLFKSDPDLVASLVPEPLEANRGGNMGIVVAQYLDGVDTPGGRIPGYNEIVIGVPAKYRRDDGSELKGMYMVQLYLADREPQSACDPTILGLVIPGYPKRVCQWQEFVRGDTRRLRIARNGSDVLGLHIDDAAPVSVPMPPLAGTSFLLKYIPAGVADRCADVLKLNAIHGTTQLTSVAQVKVRFDDDCLRLDTGVLLPVREVTMATRGLMNMESTGSVELIDYLDGYKRRVAR